MDRVIGRRSRLISLAKRGGTVFAIVAAGSAIYLWASGWIQPAIERSTVQIARVDDGP